MASSPTLVFTFNPDKLIRTSSGTNEYIAYEYSQMFKDIEKGSIKNGDKIVPDDSGTPGDPLYIHTYKTVDADGVTVAKIRTYSDTALATQVAAPAFGTTYDSSNTQVDTGELAVISLASSLNSTHAVLSYNPSKTEITVSAAVGAEITVGDFLVAELADSPGEYKLTRVIDSRKFYDSTANVFKYLLKTNERVWVNGSDIMKFTPIDSFATNYRFTHLGGFKMNAFHMPGDANTEAQQLTKILGVLDPANTNLFNTLSSKDIITFRYIVDTFDGGLNTGMAPKNILTKLAKARQKCMAIINAPSIKKFMKSNDPLFTDLPDLDNGNLQPTLNTQYIVDGGNLSLGPSFRFTLPSEDDGAKFSGTFGPFLVAKSGGKKILVPPAAYVSNLFIKKFLNGTPYAIVAGTRRGIIDEAEIVGVEYDFLDSDRDNLEPFGINPIIYRKGKGIMVYGNQSNYQRTSSAFNDLHVRDLLITIEETIEEILSNYVFEFNDPSTRLQIKSIIETYLSNVQSDGGIYTFTVQMDEKNNTNDIINQKIGIVDVTIEPAKGLQKVINRLTVTRTGGISSGGFSLA